MRAPLTHTWYLLRYLPSLFLALHCLGGATNAAQRPNILLIAIDDLRPELGCYGANHVQTPRVDQLAARGLLFERAYCQQAVCNPSRSSLMTGLRPDTIGVTGNHVHFRENRPNVVTLPQYFIRHGYHAQSIGKIYHGVFPDGASATVWDTMGDPQSWSVPTTRFGPRYYFTEEGVRQAKRSYQAMYRPKNPAADDWTEKLVFGPMTEAPDVPDKRLYDGKVADAAISVLRKFAQQPGPPFFLAVGFIKPHTPFVAPKKYFDLYEESEIALAANVELPDGAPRLAGHGSHEVRRYTDQPKQGSFSDGNQRRLKHAYYACTSFIDAQVGRVLDELQQQKLDDNTIVILFGDHGWHLGEHGLWGKTTNFELDTRVPLIVSAPGMKRVGQRTHALTELVDLYPTLAELASLPVSDQLEGASFAPLLEDPNAKGGAAAFSQFPRGGNADEGGNTMGYSLRTNRWRYTEWIERASGEVVANELYDHDNDRDETVNLASDPKQRALVSHLSRQLDRGRGWKTGGGPAAAPDVLSAPVSTTVFEQGDGNGSRFGYRIPALAVTKRNTILAFCERRVGLHDHAQNDLVLRRSTDNGKTFGPQIVVQEEGDNVLVNPCVVTLDSGRIFIMYQWFPAGYHARAGKHMKLLDPGLEGPTVSHTFVTHSDDDGLHWTKPRDVTSATKRPHVNSTATGPGIGIVLKRGPHRGRILMPTNEGWFEGKQRHFNVYACYSDDGGETWIAGEPAPNGSPGNGNEVQMVELVDGSVQLNSRSYGGSRLRKLAISRDGGANWSPLKDHGELPEPQCMGSVLRYSFPAEGGSRIVYAGPGGQKSRSHGTLRISYDEGETWPLAKEIVPGGFAYSCLTRLPNGDLGLLYEANRYQQLNFMRLPLASLEGRAAAGLASQRRAARSSKSPARIARSGDTIPLADVVASGGPRSATFAARSGVLIDDVALEQSGPLKIAAVTADQPVLPALVGCDASAICRIRIDVAGTAGDAPVVEAFSLSTAGTTDLADVEQIELYYCGKLELPSASDNANALEASSAFGVPHPAAASVEFSGRQQLMPGPNYFWVTFRLNKDANIDHRLRAVPESLTCVGGEPQPIRHAIPAGGQRMGVAVRRRGDDGVHTYRIPGLATTNRGSLIGVYDIRRRSGGDLPGDIDVGMSRSTDGGQTWHSMQVIMDMGSDPQWQYDGIGDPTVLVDRTTGTIWVAATWSHGNRSWVGSGPGMLPTETGQFMLVRSDDDGASWSQPINITEQVKRPEWSFVLQGPGKGLTMHDGTLVIPAQYQDTPENKRLPRSTFIYSHDHGATWQIASGAFDDTTEAQIVELQAGELMINCRYNRAPYRVVMTTRDLGKTWHVHPSSRQTLIEPKACMASLIRVADELGDDRPGWLLFSNPHSLRSRERITIQASQDGGVTWPHRFHRLLDVGMGAGYSCMTMIDRETVGILYEGSQAHLTFQRLRLSELMRPTGAGETGE